MRVPLKYPIGRPGHPWDAAERLMWLSSRIRRRSYLDDVESALRPLPPSLGEVFRIVQYGAVEGAIPRDRDGDAADGGDGGRDGDGGGGAPPTLPLLAAVPRRWDSSLPSVLVTGGVHGYETSGVRGALRFLLDEAPRYSRAFNVVVVPCVSPWSYETEERWNRDAVDPNRSFSRPPLVPADGGDDGGGGDGASSSSKEAVAVMDFLDGLPRCLDDDGSGGDDGDGGAAADPPRWVCHIDLHETTDSDRDEFRPARSARDGLPDYETDIPDGFYLVADDDSDSEGGGDSYLRRAEWYGAILRAVAEVTHVAPPDGGGAGGGGGEGQGERSGATICGHPSPMGGVVAVPCKSLGVCGGGAVDAEYAATTEVYPDSGRTTEEDCVGAQVAAVRAALDCILEKEGRKEREMELCDAS